MSDILKTSVALQEVSGRNNEKKKIDSPIHFFFSTNLSWFLIFLKTKTKIKYKNKWYNYKVFELISDAWKKLIIGWNEWKRRKMEVFSSPVDFCLILEQFSYFEEQEEKKEIS